MNLWVLIGVFAPWLAGMAIVYRRRGGLAGALLALGGGWLVGQVLLMLLLYASLRLTGKSHAHGLSILLLLIAVAAYLLARRVEPRGKAGRSQRGRALGHTGTGGVIVVLAALLAVSLGAKLLGIVPGLSTVTIRNDDATTFWLFKAKVIAESDRLSFDPKDPFYLGGSNPRYPVFLSLCAAWLPLLGGAWSEPLAAVPWFGFFVAMALMILGAIRLRLGSWPPALIAAYFVMSLPLASVHVYRPGYADLPLAAFLAAGVAFALLAQTEGRRVYGVGIALLMLVGAAAMKREGPVLAGVVAALMLLPEFRPLMVGSAKMSIRIVVAFLVAVVAVIFLVDLRDVWENIGQLSLHLEVLPSLVNHAYIWASFNLAFWVLPVAIILALVSRHAEMRLRVILLAVILLGVDVCIFVLTPQYRFAMNDQTPSRLFLQVLPAIIVALSLPVTTALIARAADDSSR
ncbi:MAG: hypothetical protein H6819_09245 [Phycisphaerales bacterium]|nr:hypothetical protein [Phycisphaerales bacterium]MCB9855987.1 hypothetical protein [Phycisphaerales bacterium]